MRSIAWCNRSRSGARGYTLIEVLVVVVILGIAAAMVIPAMGDTGVLKVQGALRMIVSDITFAQSDAAAFQEKRAVVFNVAENRYSVVQVPGNTVDATNNTMFDPSRPGGRLACDFRRDQRFGDARLVAADFGGTSTLIFDAMGGPVADASGNTPGTGGTVRVWGSKTAWVITVEAFTGRVTVAQDTTAVVP
jgi:general secretion pathway protein H